jgi:hypothetical protein
MKTLIKMVKEKSTKMCGFSYSVIYTGDKTKINWNGIILNPYSLQASRSFSFAAYIKDENVMVVFDTGCTEPEIYPETKSGTCERRYYPFDESLIEQLKRLL